MKTNYEIRYAAHPEDAKSYDTARIDVYKRQLQLSYKQGTCNLMNTSGVGKVTSRNIQFSVFMPIFK